MQRSNNSASGFSFLPSIGKTWAILERMHSSPACMCDFHHPIIPSFQDHWSHPIYCWVKAGYTLTGSPVYWQGLTCTAWADLDPLWYDNEAWFWTHGEQANSLQRGPRRSLIQGLLAVKQECQPLHHHAARICDFNHSVPTHSSCSRLTLFQYFILTSTKSSMTIHNSMTSTWVKIKVSW